MATIARMRGSLCACVVLLLMACSSVAQETYVPVIRVEELRVVANITLTYAQTAVSSRVRNPHYVAQESVFSFLLPDTAFVTGFTMNVDGKSYHGFVREKDYALAYYKSAKSQGLASAYLQAKPRNSNHFTVSVMVPGGSVASFFLRYEELLERKSDRYSYTVNLYPGQTVPGLSVDVYVNEGRPIRWLSTPSLSTGFGGRSQLSHDPTTTIVSWSSGDTEADVRFAPSLKKQRELMKDFKKLLAADGKKSIAEDEYSRDVAVRNTDMLGQFVVEYDVDSSTAGEVFVNNGHFIHFLNPPGLKPLSKDIVFVLDVSYSMDDGNKIGQLRSAMQSILRDLNIGDYLSIIEFAGYSKVLVRRTPVTPASIEAAVRRIADLKTASATNIMGALETALDEIHSPRPADSKHVDPIPMIIFLTDGMPNEGESDPEAIIRSVTGHNAMAPNMANIFTLAFGNDADIAFLTKLSLKNNGFMTHIYDDTDAAQQLKDFYKSISSPLMHNIVFKYPPEQVPQTSLTKHKINLVFKGTAGVTAGKANAAQITGKADFEGVVDEKERTKYLKEAAARRGRGPTEVRENFGPLERMWAYLNILKYQNSYTVNGNEEDKQKAIDLALKYQFVTPFTALALVKPYQLSDAVTIASVDGEKIEATGPMHEIQSQAPTNPESGTASAELIRKLEEALKELRVIILDQNEEIKKLRAGLEELNNEKAASIQRHSLH